MLSIGDLAHATGEPVKTLRYWQDQSLLDAERGSNGYRHFTDEMPDRVRFIRKAQALGFTLADVRHMLDARADGSAPCDTVRDLLEQHMSAVQERIEQLRAVEAALAERLAWAHRHPQPTCEDDCVYIDRGAS